LTLYNLHTPIATRSRHSCSICTEEYDGRGNDPFDGRCCDSCNTRFVIPARLLRLQRIWNGTSPD
jgi:hypothetical protein